MAVMSQKIKVKTPAHEIALVGLMVALIEVCKVAMMNIPNVEMTTFLVIMFTVFYGRPVLGTFQKRSNHGRKTENHPFGRLERDR